MKFVRKDGKPMKDFEGLEIYSKLADNDIYFPDNHYVRTGNVIKIGYKARGDKLQPHDKELIKFMKERGYRRIA